MPQSLWKRAVLAAALGVAVWAGLARADDIETLHPYVLFNPDKPHPVLNFFHLQAPLGCWASHNGYSCDSAQSQAVFVFGSCRAFYSEPCLKAPPPPPWAPNADVPPRNCGCP